MCVTREDMDGAELEQALRTVLRSAVERPFERGGRDLDERARLCERQQVIGPILHHGIPLGMREDGCDALPLQRTDRRLERTRRASVGALDEQVTAGLTKRESLELVGRDREEQLERDLRTVDDVDVDPLDDEVVAKLVDRILHLRGRRREVGAHMGRGGDRRDTVGLRKSSEGPGLLESPRTVVDARKDVRMEVDHARTIDQQTTSKTLSVLHATQPTIDGVARSVLDLVADQKGRGWAVAVASPVQVEDFLAELDARAADHHRWPATRAPGPASVSETARLARIIRRVDPDIVHLHSSKAGLAGRLALRGRRPTVFQPHAWSFEAVSGLQRRAAVRWERAAARWAGAIVCVSEAERLRGEALGIRGAFRVIPNGVDVSAFSPASPDDRRAARAGLGLAEAPLVVCVGRLTRQKGQDVLLSAWPSVLARVPDAQLVLLGEGPERDELQRDAPPGVVFAGKRPDVPDWLAAADVVAAPSRWEGMSIALLEALARARPVVASDTPGAAEAIGSRAGAIVPVEDPDALANALVDRLLDPARAASEGLEARTRVEEHYDLRRALDGVAALYAELV